MCFFLGGGLGEKTESKKKKTQKMISELLYDPHKNSKREELIKKYQKIGSRYFEKKMILEIENDICNKIFSTTEEYLKQPLSDNQKRALHFISQYLRKDGTSAILYSLLLSELEPFQNNSSADVLILLSMLVFRNKNRLECQEDFEKIKNQLVLSKDDIYCIKHSIDIAYYCPLIYNELGKELVKYLSFYHPRIITNWYFIHMVRHFMNASTESKCQNESKYVKQISDIYYNQLMVSKWFHSSDNIIIGNDKNQLMLGEMYDSFDKDLNVLPRQGMNDPYLICETKKEEDDIYQEYLVFSVQYYLTFHKENNGFEEYFRSQKNIQNKKDLLEVLKGIKRKYGFKGYIVFEKDSNFIFKLRSDEENQPNISFWRLNKKKLTCIYKSIPNFRSYTIFSDEKGNPSYISPDCRFLEHSKQYLEKKQYILSTKQIGSSIDVMVHFEDENFFQEMSNELNFELIKESKKLSNGEFFLTCHSNGKFLSADVLPNIQGNNNEKKKEKQFFHNIKTKETKQYEIIQKNENNNIISKLVEFVRRLKIQNDAVLHFVHDDQESSRFVGISDNVKYIPHYRSDVQSILSMMNIKDPLFWIFYSGMEVLYFLKNLFQNGTILLKKMNPRNYFNELFCPIQGFLISFQDDKKFEENMYWLEYSEYQYVKKKGYVFPDVEFFIQHEKFLPHFPVYQKIHEIYKYMTNEYIPKIRSEFKIWKENNTIEYFRKHKGKKILKNEDKLFFYYLSKILKLPKYFIQAMKQKTKLTYSLARVLFSEIENDKKQKKPYLKIFLP